MNNDDLLKRALSAWYRTSFEAVSVEDSGIEKQGDLMYVILRQTGQEILAVYRVRNDGQLKRLRRIPKALRS